MDAKEISEKHAKAKAARSSWVGVAIDSLAAVGQKLIGQREQVRTASAPERKSPFSTNQIESVSRLDQGAAASGPRDIRMIAQQDRDRQVNNTVALARRLVETKLRSLPSVIGSNIMYLKADISRWDDQSGKPQTGRVSFQIPFHGPQGDPRTIYASVDLVMGDLMEPKTFSDGLNKVYAFDSSGLKQLFQGQEFEVVHQPKVMPETKFTGPEQHAPDGIPGAVAAVNSPLIFRKGPSEIVRQASGVKPTIAREGLVRSISKEAAQIAPVVSPAEVQKLKKAPAPREVSDAISNYPGGKESNTPYQQHGQGGQMDPTLAQRAEVREINWDGTVRGKTPMASISDALDFARKVTYGGHDYVVEVYDESGSLVERIAKSGSRTKTGGIRFNVTARVVLAASKSKHEKSKKEPKFDMVGMIMAFESGELDDDGVIKLFQHLVDTGMAWRLQGSYGRAAKSLLDQGLIQPAEKDQSDAYGNTVPGKPRSNPPVEIAEEPQQHEDSPSLEDEGKGLGSYESASGGVVRVASGMSKVIQDLRMLDVRMINFRDLVLLCKQHGSERDIAFDSASKDLAKAGIILYRTASAQPDNSIQHRLAHVKRLRLAAPPEAPVANELPAASQTPGDTPEAAAPEQVPAQGKPQIAPPSGLDPVEFKEYQRLIDQYNNEWETVHQRELNNIKNGTQPHMGIDYTNLQMLYDKIDAFQQSSQQRKTDELAESPADLAGQDKVAPAQSAAPGGEPSPTGAPEGTTLLPEKGKGLAGQAPRMTRAALDQALDMKNQGATVLDGVETVAANTADIGAATGGGTSIPKAAGAELADDAKNNMMNMGLDPNNPAHVKQFMANTKSAAQSLKFPEVCKNCKNLVVPVGYSPLREFKHTRLPFCGAAKASSVGFRYAYFRDCAGYDPIVKEIGQKIESIAPESEQTEKDSDKGQKPIMERGGSKFAGTLTAESLPSAAPESVHSKDSQTGVAADIRKWCEQNGHYAPAGDVHPTHDWCTLWNTAVENLVKLPSGAVVPKSVSGQSSETAGEGGPHQFDETPNQNI